MFEYDEKNVNFKMILFLLKMCQVERFKTVFFKY